MKKLAFSVAVLLIAWAGPMTAQAASTLFDFDGATSFTINTYMTSLFGDPVTVSNATISVNGPLYSGVSGDKALMGMLQTLTITFAEPITAVSFDWATTNGSFSASADGTQYLSHALTIGNYVENGVTYTFASPVTTLTFSGNGFFYLDNLEVTPYTPGPGPVPVPAPGAMLLASMGALTVSFIRRHGIV